MTSTRPAILQWTTPGRAVVFVLAAASIWCLLSEFYGLCTMRTFTFWVLIPATIALLIIALYDRARGDHQLWRNVIIGMAAGLAAAVAYDLFRIPFVVAAIDHVGPGWLRLPLFKVFPRFGAMILGQSFSAQQTDSQFSLTTHLVGWAYHLSNGITFGVMYTAMLGDARRKTWWWGVVMAVGLELFMLATPYSGFFGIKIGTPFIVATLTAHLIFGAVMGLIVRAWSNAWVPAFLVPSPGTPGEG